MDKINVLGTTYTVEFKRVDEDNCLEDKQAYANLQEKRIVLRQDEEDLAVFRHESLHAFLYECGLDTETWGRNEEIVDWIALQFPKLKLLFEKMEAIKNGRDKNM